MNVYDFDNTVYRGDSTAHFYFYCLKRHPAMALRAVQLGLAAANFALGRYDRTRFKQFLFRFLRDVPDAEAEVEAFWRVHAKNLKPFYLAQKRPDDVIISASPEFLLEPICRTLGVRLIASRVDPHTGLYAGHNCGGAEKVRRFREVYPNAAVREFYSDSLRDDPLARLAQSAFLVKGDDIAPWPKLGD